MGRLHVGAGLTLQSTIIGAFAALALVAGAFLAGRWTAPDAPQAQQEAAERLRQVVVTKYVERARATKRHSVTVAQPDGSSVTTTDESSVETEATTETPPPASEVAPLLAAATVRAQPQWRVGAGAGLTTDYSSVNVVYAFEIDRRLLGPVWLGLRATTVPSVALTLSVEF